MAAAIISAVAWRLPIEPLAYEDCSRVVKRGFSTAAAATVLPALARVVTMRGAPDLVNSAASFEPVSATTAALGCFRHVAGLL